MDDDMEIDIDNLEFDDIPDLDQIPANLDLAEMAKKSHESLTQAKINLMSLADTCENNFKKPNVIDNMEITIENASK